MYTNRYGWGWLMFDDFGSTSLGHEGSNTMWYCICQVVASKGMGFLAVSNIGADEHGKGAFACAKVIDKLRERQFLM